MQRTPFGRTPPRLSPIGAGLSLTRHCTIALLAYGVTAALAPVSAEPAPAQATVIEAQLGRPLPPPIFAGSVRDAAGRGIAGAEVLIVAAELAAPAVRVWSDGDGRFRLPELNPGLYRFAAVKPGYATSVGSINTRLQRWVEVVLRPTPSAEQSAFPAPADRSWILRAPRRGVFREKRRTSDVTATTEPRPTHWTDDVTLQLDHLHDLTTVGGGGDEGAEPGGFSTRLRVASAVGQSTRVEVDGHRERLDRAWVGDATTRGAETQTRDWRLGVSYDTGPDAQLSMQAFYNSSDLAWAESADSPTWSPGTQDGSARSWGYNSRLSMQLDGESRVDVRFDFADARFEAMAGGGVSDRVVQATNRQLVAGGTYQGSFDDHALEVDLEARLLDGEEWQESDERRVYLLGEPGWSLMLDASDAWALAGPFTLVYGLGYRQTMTPLGSSWLLPRVGGQWSFAPIGFGFSVSYLTEEGPRAQAMRSLGELVSPAERTGYDVNVDIPIARGLSLRASTRFTPVLLRSDAMDWARTSWQDLEPFRTDGNASLEETRLSLQHTAARTATYAEWWLGMVDGRVDPWRSYEPALGWLTLSRLRFHNGRVGVRVIPTGTDVRVEYREVRSFVPGQGTLESEQDTLELRIMQDLMRGDSLGHWRLLMAIRTETLGERAPLEAADEAEVISAKNSGLRAGLSVVF